MNSLILEVLKIILKDVKELIKLKDKKEMAEKASLKDQDIFEDKVTDSKEFEALNKIREASGKEPLKVDEKFSQFLGKDSEKSMKESLDSIAENIKKDPKLKKSILDALSE